MKKTTKILVSLFLILAFASRVLGISSFPAGFTQDEAAIGYDAYSLLKTGADQWGKTWPLVLRSFGDFKMPLYSYLAIPSIAVFGLNEFATRLPNAFIGTLAVLLTLLMSNQLFRGRKFEIWHLKFGILPAFLLAISPWHVSLSRGAFESNMTTFFIPLGVWLYFLGLKNPKYLAFSSLAFGLNLFSYHSARLFTILFIPVLLFLTRKELKNLLSKNFSKLTPSILILGGFFILLLYSFVSGAGRRAADVTIFNPTDKWAYVSDRRYEAVLQGLPTQTARIFSNKATYLFHRFTSNYLSYLSPHFLFTEGVSEWSYGMIPGRGVLYSLEIIPVFLGIAMFFKGRGDKNMKLLLIWILLATIPAALSKGAGGSGTRAATMMPAIQILSATGFLYGLNWLKSKYSRLGKLVYPAILGLYLISFTFFLEDYRYHANVAGAKSMQYGMKQVISYIGKVESDYDEVLLSRSLSVPNIWVQFYLKIDPAKVQQASKEWLVYEDQGLVSIDQMDRYSLGKYTISGIDKEKLSRKKGILVVGKPEEFRVGQTVLHTVYYPDKTPAYVIVDASSM